MKKKIQPYGLWRSTLSASMVGQRVRLEDVQWDSDDLTLIWLERRSGVGVLICQPEESSRRDLISEHNVHGGVGYGGGDFTVNQGLVFFAEKDGRIYRRSLGYGQPQPITPSYGGAASPCLSPDGSWVVYVFSDGKVDLLGLVDSDGKEWPRKLVSGADFYMQPVWHPWGEFIAWIEWDHPNMPWDGTRLKLGKIEGEIPALITQTLVAGDVHTPVSSPQFSPDGAWLSYVSSNGEWEKLVIYNIETGEQKTLINGDGFMLSSPAWGQGMRSYGWSQSGKRIYYTRVAAGTASLWTVDVESRESTQIDTSPYTWIDQLAVSPVADQLAFLASAPGIPDRIVRWDGKRLRVVCHSDPENLSPDLLPQPKPISWKAPDGTKVYGIFYAPVSPQFEGQGLPPVIVFVHGGPTGFTAVNYSAQRAYFNTRGYGWLDVNYRGSPGYGRSYQEALRENWGKVDTEDAIGAAKALDETGLGDKSRLIIMGGSAGGYLVLNALTQYPGTFKAGICCFGVSNLFTLAMDTHKFEAHYLDSMVGVLPDASKRYHDWSPIFHAKNISDPLAVFQGADDKVVPPNQSEEIVTALRQNGVAHIYRLYQGEGHGFRKSESIIDFLEQTERFIQQYVLFTG